MSRNDPKTTSLMTSLTKMRTPSRKIFFECNLLDCRDERTVKFFSPSPVLIRWNWIQFSPDPQNFWKSLVRSSPDLPMSNHVLLFCLMRQKNYWSYFAFSQMFGWRQNSSSSAFASWGIIDPAFWHFQNQQGMVWFNHAFLWLKSRNNTKQQEEIQ